VQRTRVPAVPQPLDGLDTAARQRPVTEEEVVAAQRRLRDVVRRTPLLPLDGAPTRVHVKLENLQPIGSFKIRSAANKLLSLQPDQLKAGVWTASAGNMAQGVAWCARRLGVRASIVVPDSASEAKLAAIRLLGARIESVSREEFYEIFATRRRSGMHGLFIHAFSDSEVMAGNATIGIEILEELPQVRAIFVPYGGGGLSCGIAALVRSRAPDVRIIACEPETAAPLAAYFAGGSMQGGFAPSFVDGAGAPRLYPEMEYLARELIDEAVAVPLPDVANAIRMLAERCHVVAEGAGALSVAAAMRHAAAGPVACVVSGGNINRAWLAAALAGDVPVV
jgi:threonine dehydratase